MKYLKWPLLILLGLIIVYVLLCVVGPKNMNTSKTTSIEAAPSQVFNLVNNLKNWESWSPWSDMDTTQVITYGDLSEGKGGNYSWKGDSNGSGDLIITESVKNEKTKVTMNFHDYGSTSFIGLDLASNGKSVDLTWSMVDENDLPFLVRGMMFVQGMKKTMSKNFEQGLSNIKSIAEKRAKGNYLGFQINPIDLPETHYVMNRQEVNIDKVQQFYAANLGSLFGKLQKSGIEMKGKPCGLFYRWNDPAVTVDMAAAIPVAEAVAIQGASSLTIPSGNALQIDYYGDFEGSMNAHFAMEAYMKDYGLLSNPPIIEEYVTDPSEETDPSKWLTKITYYISE